MEGVNLSCRSDEHLWPGLMLGCGWDAAALQHECGVCHVFDILFGLRLNDALTT